MKTISLLYLHATNKRKYLFTIQYTSLILHNDMRVTCYIEASHPHQIPWLNIRSFEADFLFEDGRYDFAFESCYTGSSELKLLMNSLCISIMKNEQLQAKLPLRVFEEAYDLVA